MTRLDDDPDATMTSPRTAPMQSEARQRHRFDDPVWTVWLVGSDFVMAAISAVVGVVAVAIVARSHLNQLDEFDSNLKHLALFPVTVVLGMGVTGTYRASLRSPNESTFTMLKDFLLGIALGGVLSLFLSNLLHHVLSLHRTSSSDLVAVIVIAFVLVPVGRATVRYVALTRRPLRVLIVDSGLRKNRIATHVAIQHGFELVGWVVSSEPIPEGAAGTLEQLPRIVDDLQIDKVIVGSTGRIGAETASVYRQILPVASVSIVPRSFELISWRSQLTDLSGLPLLEVAPPLHTKADRIAKRVVDIAASIVALIITAPLWLVIAILIKLTSPGPLFFTQDRLGRSRSGFRIIKFRTMTEASPRPDADEKEAFGDAGDDETPLHRHRRKEEAAKHVTRVGALLRRTGLDELPQFINVLKGEMSIVGPRPFVTAESEPLDGWSARRFEVRPGITGLWQVSGRNELTSDELRQLDYLYVSSWSMAWDVRIMLETPGAMVRGLGAY